MTRKDFTLRYAARAVNAFIKSKPDLACAFTVEYKRGHLFAIEGPYRNRIILGEGRVDGLAVVMYAGDDCVDGPEELEEDACTLIRSSAGIDYLMHDLLVDYGWQGNEYEYGLTA